MVGGNGQTKIRNIYICAFVYAPHFVEIIFEKDTGFVYDTFCVHKWKFWMQSCFCTL